MDGGYGTDKRINFWHDIWMTESPIINNFTQDLRTYRNNNNKLFNEQ